MSGLLLYNTIYWRRASDGLNPPRLTPEERKNYAPPKDFDVIKPREKPRARLDEVKRRQRAEEFAKVRLKLPRSVVHDDPGPASEEREEFRPAPFGGERPAGMYHRTPPAGMTVVKRRRKHRSHRASVEDSTAVGFLARLVSKWRR